MLTKKATSKELEYKNDATKVIQGFKNELKTLYYIAVNALYDIVSDNLCDISTFEKENY
jgi:hypothetical protein